MRSANCCHRSTPRSRKGRNPPMPERITSLTPEQLAMLPGIRDEWLAHGFSTDIAARRAAEAGIRAAYQAAGLEPPRVIIWAGSPWTGVIAKILAPSIIGRHAQVYAQVYAQVGDQVYAQVYAQVRAQVGAQVRDQVRAQVGAQVGAQVYAQVGDQVGDQVGAQVGAQVYAQVDDQVGDQVGDQVRDQVYAQVGAQVGAQVRAGLREQSWYAGRLAGQHWAGYYSYFAAMAAVGVQNLEPILAGQLEVARNAGWWWAFRGFAVVTDRPAVLHRDPLGRLHCADGPAIRYRDGWGFHAWHGRRVPAWVVESPTITRIGQEDNVEVRRCAIESLGWDRFTREAGLARSGSCVPDPGNPGQLLELWDVPEELWGSAVRLLMCANGSAERDGTRRRYGLTVPARISGPLEAAA